jgi:cysteine desulfurase
MGKAAAIGMRDYETNHKKLLLMRQYLMERISREIPYCKINGSMQYRLDGNVNVSFRYLEGEALIFLLDSEGVCVSGGSACSAAEHSISHVLQGIGLPEEWARGTIRISLGADNTMEEMELFFDKLKQLVTNLRELSDEYRLSDR